MPHLQAQQGGGGVGVKARQGQNRMLLCGAFSFMGQGKVCV